MHLRSILSIFLIVVTLLCQAVPITVDRTPERFSGTIEGSPVIAVLHGPSAPLKDDVQEKDSQNDPLAKFGPQME